MKFSELCVGLGLGVSIGLLGGALIMNNCRRVRRKVAECQEALSDKIEAKKRDFIEQKTAKNVVVQAVDTVTDAATSVAEKVSKKFKKEK